MRTKLILAFLLFGQDVPQMRPIQCADAVTETGTLHLQLKQRDEYIATLQAKIKELQEKQDKK